MKSTIKKIIPLFAVFILLPLTVFATESNKTTQEVPAATNQYYYVQVADVADIKPGTLTLNQIFPNVLWFTDQPNGRAGYIAMKKYLTFWAPSTPGSLSRHHPNTALVGYAIDKKNGTKERVSLVFTLSNPKYDSKTHTLTYKTKKMVFATPDGTDPYHHRGTYVLHQPSLFIDPFVSPGTW